jgi:hypothetical protein
MLENIENVWDTGAVTPYGASKDQPDFYEKFKKRTGATRAVALRWTYQSQTHEWPGSSTLLPDRTGLVVPKIERPEGGYRELAVIKPDGTQQCIIVVPRIDEHSKPEQGYLTLVTERKPELTEGWWGIGGFDGYRYALFCFDWQTGQLKDWEEKSGGWAMWNAVFQMPSAAG